MFAERRRLKALKTALGEIDVKFAPRFRAAQSDDDYLPLRDEYEWEAGKITSRIEQINTQRFKRRLARFGIEIPPYEEYWEINSSTGISYLTERAYAKFNRERKEARFVYWERWAKLLVPILSLLIAIIALLRR